MLGYKWKKACDNKNDVEAQQELHRVLNHVFEANIKWPQFAHSCNILECINKVRRKHAFKNTECNNDMDTLEMESWDDHPLDNIYMTKAGEATYCFTRAELDGFEPYRNPYTQQPLPPKEELFKQRWFDLLYEEDKEPVKLPLETLITIGIASAFRGQPSYNAIDGEQFRTAFNTKNALLTLLTNLVNAQTGTDTFATLLNDPGFIPLFELPETPENILKIQAYFAQKMAKLPDVMESDMAQTVFQQAVEGFPTETLPLIFSKLLLPLMKLQWPDDVTVNVNGPVTTWTWRNPNNWNESIIEVYENGVIQSTTTVFMSVVLHQSKYKNGLRHGKEVFYNRNRELVQTMNWDNGQKHGQEKRMYNIPHQILMWEHGRLVK